MKLLFFNFLFFVFFISCAVKKESALNVHNVVPGMSKEQVVSKAGTPFKSGFFYTDDNVLVEELYYKELIYNNYQTNEVITLLTFHNNELVSNQLVSDFPVETSSN